MIDAHEDRVGPIVTLDGPAGSGKSTTAREVARRLGFRHLDSGALYRALTLALLESGIAQEEWAEMDEHAMRALDVTVTPRGTELEVTVGGRRVGRELRSEEVTSRVAYLASLPAARACLLNLQRAAGAQGRLVADGRDMGSVVFPHADVKVYLVADLGERARRRLKDGGVEEPSGDDVESQSAVIARRDRHDSEREHSPLRKPEDAHLLDTTRLTFEDQVTAVIELVEGV
ncbi:MAG: (d)CMP kinase [Gemmatimonadota bacterium]|nr:(d)CMP kinase [Gemmatimonadota bacterium]MDH3424626.1 (d)CMP kinase [Gemmatimonadota bacterium]